MTDRMLVLSSLLLAPALAHAQTIHGVVVEEGAGEAIADAQVEVLDTEGRAVAAARTNRSGAFLLRLRGPGSFTVRLSRLGYTTVETEAVVLSASETVSVELRMARAAIPLEPLVVRARADSRGIGGFYERMNRPAAVGHFITRDRIDRRRGAWATDLLREIPGVYTHRVYCHFTPCGNLVTMRGLGIGTERDPARPLGGEAPVAGTERSPEQGGMAGRRYIATDLCFPTVYVDGMLMDQGETLDGILKPEVLEGIEVYPRGTSAPSPILARDGCGVVAFWTRGIDVPGFSLKRFGTWLGGMALMFGLASHLW